jgi:cell division protein FtsL
MSKRGSHVFIALWTLAVTASVCAFVLHLAMRGRTVALGYELGRARAEQARLREVKRVLQVEAASYKTPERVEIVARTLLGMEPPAPDRIVPLAAVPDRGQKDVGRADARPEGQGNAAVAEKDRDEGTPP